MYFVFFAHFFLPLVFFVKHGHGEGGVRRGL